METDPNYMLAYKDLGKYYYDAGKYEEAKENYGKYIASTKPTLIKEYSIFKHTIFCKDYEKGVK
nr:hypothetical protein [Candidatus Brachybacter algidus]